MKAAVLTSPANIASRPLEIRDIPVPTPAPGQVLLRVRACGVCRTDLHIVEGELKPLRDHVIPGHQIVGEAIGSDGGRFGVTWMAGIDGTCEYCLRGEENLCDSPVFTGYTVDGGYAEYAVARSDFAIPLPAGLRISKSHPCCAPASSDSAACGWRASSAASVSGCSASAPRRISRFPCCGPGAVASRCPRAEHRTASWPSPWARIGWDPSATAPRSRSTAPSPSLPAAMS